MSKESLDYEKLCSNYYSSWEDGCCMESCEFYNHNECPVVYVNGFLEERDKTIADLEAKLAESEKLKENYDILRCQHKSLGEFCDELKQQLAEKESKIETLKQRIDSIVKIYSDDFVSKDTELKELRYKVKQYNQDKISFAVEQLKKVKKDIDCYMAIRECDLPYNIECLLLDFANKIDNQIEELKKEMK